MSTANISKAPQNNEKTLEKSSMILIFYPFEFFDFIPYELRYGGGTGAILRELYG